MKLRARFPQIGLARADSGVLRRASGPTSSGSGPAMAEPVAAPVSAPIAPASPAARLVPVTTSEFAPPQDWPSTVAAWRSTTGKPGDRP